MTDLSGLNDQSQNSQDEPLNPVPVPPIADLEATPLDPFGCLTVTDPLEPEAIPMHLAMLTIAVAALREQVEALEHDRNNCDWPGDGN